MEPILSDCGSNSVGQIIMEPNDLYFIICFFQNPFSSNNWRRPNETNYSEASSATNDRTQRLGLTTGYGGGLNGYGYSSSGVGGYAPLKIDLGGVVLGTLVGIGALLILPKLVTAFGGGYGGHYRSENGDGDFTQLLNKVDDMLAQNNIDSGSCLQKAICTYVQKSDYHMQVGTADQIEHMILALAENSLVDYMLDGTAIKEAIKNGKAQSRSCDELYKSCPLDRQSAYQMASKIFRVGGN
ncbi:AAEL002803-PA [Aedes aegypti]|uniref:AAEL002803-PA n=1 Tax=Aedes aegypti TaxID=7159 RepID=Q17H28_AEDAE|nr:AAEL002803-PA [Aedes aegypti]